MPKKTSVSTELTQQQQMQQMQQQKQSQQFQRNSYNDDSVSLNRHAFIREARAKFINIYHKHKRKGMSLDPIFHEIRQVGVAVFRESQKSKDYDFSVLQTNSLNCLYKEIDALLDSTEDKDLIGAIKLVRVVMSLIIMRDVKYYGENFLLKEDCNESFIRVLQSSIYLGLIFDLLVGNITDYCSVDEYYSHFKIDMPFPNNRYGGKIEYLTNSDMMLSLQAFNHFFERGFENFMGGRIWVDVNYESKEVVSLKTEDLPESLHRDLYIKDNVLRFDPEVSNSKNNEPHNLDNTQDIIDNLKKTTIFNKESEKNSVWILLAMVKNDHSFRAGVSFEVLVPDRSQEMPSIGLAVEGGAPGRSHEGGALKPTNEESYETLRSSYNNFIKKHNDFIQDLPNLWKKSFFDKLKSYENTVALSIAEIKNIENIDYKLKSTVLAEIEHHKSSCEAFCKKVDDLLKFAINVFKIDTTEEGCDVADLPLKIRDMLPPQRVDEDTIIAKQKSIGDLVANHITGFEDLKIAFEMQKDLSSKQENRKSNAKILQDCLSERISFVFQASHFFAVRDADNTFDKDKFFNILAFHIFKEAFGKNYTLSQFKSFNDQAQSEVPGVFTKMLSSVYGSGLDFGSNDARELVDSSQSEFISNVLLRNPKVRHFYNTLKLVGANISQHRILKILANPISTDDKIAQANALLDLSPYVMHFPSQFMSKKQDTLHFRNDYLASHCYPLSVIEDGFGSSIYEQYDQVKEFISRLGLQYDRVKYFISRLGLPSIEPNYVLPYLKDNFGNGEKNLTCLMVAMAREYEVAAIEDYSDDDANKVFHTWAARVPYYEYTAFEKIDNQITEKLASVTISPTMRRKIRHAVLESALVDRDQNLTLKNWEIIISSIKEMFEFKSSALAAGTNNGAGVINVVGSAINQITRTERYKLIYLDQYIDKVMENLRHCSSDAVKAYVRAAEESYKELQVGNFTGVIVGYAQKKQDINGQPVRFTYNLLAPVIKFLHDNGLGMSFLNGLTDINLEPFIPANENEEDDESGSEDQKHIAKNKAFYYRLSFFLEAYKIKKSPGKECWVFEDKDNHYRLREEDRRLYSAFLRGLSTNKHQYFVELLKDTILQFNEDKKNILSYCIETAVKMSVAVDDVLLQAFVDLAKNSELKFEEANLDSIDAQIDRIGAIAEKGGVAAKDFDFLLTRINTDYLDDSISMEYIKKIIRSMKCEGRVMRSATDLIAEFKRLKVLNRSMRHLALEKLLYLGKDNTQESSLLSIIKNLNSNEAAGFLTNFAEAVIDVRRKADDVPKDLLAIGSEFLSSCDNGVNTPSARVSLAKSLLFGYEKGHVSRDASVIEFHKLPDNLFSVLEETEVEQFAMFSKLVGDFEVILKSYELYKDFTSAQYQHLVDFRSNLEKLHKDINSLQENYNNTNSLLDLHKTKQDRLRDTISDKEQGLETLKSDYEENKSNLVAGLEGVKGELSKTNSYEDDEGTDFVTDNIVTNEDLTDKVNELKGQIEKLDYDYSRKCSDQEESLANNREEKNKVDKDVLASEGEAENLGAKLELLRSILKESKNRANSFIQEASTRFVKCHDVMRKEYKKLERARSLVIDSEDLTDIVTEQKAIDFYNEKIEFVKKSNTIYRAQYSNFIEQLIEISQELEKSDSQESDYGIKDQIAVINSAEAQSLNYDAAEGDKTVSAISVEEGATALHIKICKILTKRVGASEDVWIMLDNAFRVRITAYKLYSTISHANYILEEHLPGEASVIFAAVIKYYRASPKAFVELVEKLREIKPGKNQALLLKLSYAYVENGEGLDSIQDLLSHLGSNNDKAEILESRLVHPPYWSVKDIEDKSAPELEERTSYPRVNREYEKFDSVVAKFKSSTANNLFTGTFDNKGFKDYIKSKDESTHDLVSYQAYLAQQRSNFAENTEKVTDKDILDVVFAVSEVLANVGFDKDQSGNKIAKELRLEQIMSVYAWLKLGFSGDTGSQTTVWNQVETGEGKSRITAVAAGASAVLSGGKTIEMTFNSQALALRGLEEFSFLFKQMFNESVRTDIGLVVDPKVNPSAYKSSKEGVQAVNFISISHYLLASKASDVPLVNYLTETHRTEIDKKATKSAFIVSREDCADAVQELLNLDVPYGNIKVVNNENISKEIKACKCLNQDIDVVVVSLESYDDVTNIIAKPDAYKVDFTDTKGIIRIVDEADDGSNLHMPCNISSSSVGNGYWDGPNGDDGIYRYITEWSFEKLSENSSLSSDSLMPKHLEEFIDFVNSEEEGNSNKDSCRIIRATIGHIDLSQLRIWFDSVKSAHSLQMGVDFVVEDGYRGEYGENCFAIIPLNRGGAAMPGSIFSKGVHQILRYLVNTNQVKRIVRKQTIKNIFLSLLGWQIQDRVAISDKNMRLARPVESPIVSSKKNLIVLPNSAHDERDKNIAISFKTTGTAPLQVATAAGEKILETPRATDLKRSHLPTVYAPDTMDKIRSIIRDVTECMLEERPCMVLCEDEKESDFVYRVLDQFITADIRKYSSTLSQEDQRSLIKSAGQVGKVTVGPVVDLGRGIDVVPNEAAIKNGGMHLIMTSYPEDRATYLQAVARSGRNGVRGTVRLIVEGPIDSESARASCVKSYNKNADVAQIQSVFDAPWNTFEKKTRDLKLSASNQKVINTLRAKLHELQEGNKDKALFLVQKAMSSKFLNFFGFLRFRGISKATRILQDYHLRVVGEYNKVLASQTIDEELKQSLALSTGDFKDISKDCLDYLSNLREAHISYQDIPVVSEYDPSHAGQAVLYSNPLWFIDATIKGHNVIADHFFTLFRGGELFPNLKASLYSWRILPPGIAELREYFKLETGSNDANVVSKSLLKISSYSIFLSSVLLVPFFAGWPLALGVSSLFTAGAYLYYKSSLIKVKGQCKMISRSRLENSIADGLSKDSDAYTVYVAPLFLRRAAQILVFALCILMIVGAYFASVPLFYLIYAKMGVALNIAKFIWPMQQAILNFTNVYSYVLTLLLSFSMYEFYTSEENRHLFELPKNLAVDGKNKLLGVISGLGKNIAARSIGMIGLCVILGLNSLLLYRLLAVVLLEAGIFILFGPLSSLFSSIILPIAIVVLIKLVIFVKRCIMWEISLNEFKSIYRYLVDLAFSNILTIISLTQFCAMLMILTMIITPYPPLLFLGVNVIPLIHSGIIATYLVCCLDHCKYLFASALYLSNVHMKKDIIGKDTKKAQAYREKNANTLLGSFFTNIGHIIGFLSKNSLADIIKGDIKTVASKDNNSYRFNIKAAEKEWKERNASAIKDRNKKLLIKVLKGLLSGVAAAGSYMLVIAMMPSPLGLTLALAVAIYVGIFVDSYLEDMGFYFAFGTRSNFSYLLPEVKKVKKGSPFWYSVKCKLQKTINAIMMIFLSPLYFAYVTLKLPFKFLLNIIEQKGSNIANMQLSNLISFIITFFFLFITVGSAPLAGAPLLINICMALYLNSMLSFGIMKFFGVISSGSTSFVDFQGGSHNSFSTRCWRFIGMVNELIFGCDTNELFDSFGLSHAVENDGFKPWVEGNAEPKFIDDAGIGHTPYSPLGRINNFKGA